jgi:hypothetical protein
MIRSMALWMPREKNRSDLGTVVREEPVWGVFGGEGGELGSAGGAGGRGGSGGYGSAGAGYGGMGPVVWVERVVMAWEDLLARTPNAC